MKELKGNHPRMSIVDVIFVASFDFIFNALTLFMPVASFYTPLKHQKTKGT